MASDLAMVLGFTGLMMSLSSLMAVVIGLQPVACAANTFVFTNGTRPSFSSSLNDFHILVISDPLAFGTTMLCGVFHPSCSATSNPRDLEPSGPAGVKMTLFIPARAAGADTEFARLPVDAQAAVSNPNSFALVMATATTRSLNESVGGFTEPSLR